MKAFSRQVRLSSLARPYVSPNALNTRCRASSQVLLSRSADASKRDFSSSHMRAQLNDGDIFDESTLSNVPSYSDDELHSLLHDLLATPELPPTPTQQLAETLQQRVAPPTRDHSPILALQNLQMRLNLPTEEGGAALSSPSSDTVPKAQSLAERLAERSGISLVTTSSKFLEQLCPGSQYGSILGRFESIITSAEQGFASSSKLKVTDLQIPLGVASDEEWKDLMRACIQAGDFAAAQKTLGLAERSASRSLAELRDLLLLGLVSTKDVDGVKHFFRQLSAHGVQPTGIQRHLHVKVYLDTHEHSKAQDLIHLYEVEGHPPPESTYVALIRAYLSTPSSLSANRHRALAWDMFAHMRYVAYPVPSAETYSTMIQACAEATVPSPERALDLFTEMTVDNQISPTREAYNGLILTCARSPKKEYAHEAFRRGKELVDLYQNATTPEAREAFRPNIETFYGLLESTKRTGDLGRARWILAEILRAGERVDDRIMGNVFQVYGKYKPPFRRSDVVTTTNQTAESQDPSPMEATADVKNGPKEPVPLKNGGANRIPQDHAEVVREAEALFARILNANELRHPDTSLEHPDPAFARVEINTHLINSYLPVLYQHSSLDSAISSFKDLFSRFGNVGKNSQSFDDMFARLAHTRDKIERGRAHIFADCLWKEWLNWSKGKDEFLSPRRVERIWANMIRITTFSGDLEAAIDLVKQFTKRYPPGALLSSAPVPNAPQTNALTVGSSAPPPSTTARQISSRVTLEGRRPLVRLSLNHEIRDDPVPPFLSFKDVELLHQRLVHDVTSNPRRKKQIDYLSYVLISYGAMLRKKKNTVTSGDVESATANADADSTTA